jgi:tripartite-type tricarboxylate transporter receptor subunit TctC
MSKRFVALVGAGVASLALAACGSSAPSTSSAGAGAADDGFPKSDIKMVVSYAAGGPTDVAGRAIAKYMEKEFGVSVVVENKDGASGAVGTANVAKSKPDGYTITMTTGSAVGRVPLIQQVGYEFKDVQPIGVATFGPGLLLVGGDSPYKTFDELVAASKAKPGSVKIGTAGTSAPQHVELVRMEKQYNVDLTLVPFKGEAPAVTAVLGGNVDGCFCSNAQTTMAQVTAGKFKVLATASPERLPSMPDVPTLVESGFPELIYGNSYFILAAPAGIPSDVLAKLEGGLKAALNDPETVKTIGKERLLENFMGSAALTQMLQEEQQALGPLLKELFVK